MATTINTNTFATTYKDDFKDSDNYHRILFNAGRALQARELTQSQTIIQKEIERFGNNIFKEGALVRPGGIQLDVNKEFVKLNGFGSQDFTDTSVGDEFTSQDGTAIKFKVIEKIAGTSVSDPDTFFVKYTDTTGGTAGSSPVRIPDGAQITATSPSRTLTLAASNATGLGSKVSSANADYFVQGHFVFVEQQELVLDKYSSTPTADVGFKIVEEVVTVADDAGLYDNQGASPNVAAPGADRYRIRLILTTQSAIQSGENFVYIGRIEKGKIVDQITTATEYDTIADFMALRTKEESGDYITNPILASFNDLNDSELTVDVTKGVAYVDGYRVDLPTKSITLKKAQDEISLTDQKAVAAYGSYIVVRSEKTFAKGLPNIDTRERWNLNDATDYGGNVIGTARIRNVEKDGSNLRFYLFDIRMNTNVGVPGSFEDTRSIGLSVNAYADLVLDNGVASLKATNNNTLLFELPFTAPTLTGFAASSVDYNFRARVTDTTDGTGQATFQAPTNSKFAGSPSLEYVISELDSAPGTTDYTPSFASTGATSIDVTGLPANTAFEMIATFDNDDLSNNNLRTKTLEERTLTVAWPADADSDGNGTKYIDLQRADIYSVNRIRTTDSDGDDLLSFFSVDDGQRDNFYAKGRLLERAGTTVPTSNIFVRYKHFSHQDKGAEYSYFNVQSYENAFNNAAGGNKTGDAAYKAIGSYRRSDNKTVSLRDVFDFRPVENYAGDYDSSGTGTGASPIINHLPRPNSLITADITHYQKRKDKIVAVSESVRNVRNGRGTTKIITGTSSLVNPQPPEVPTGALTLYDVELNPYTFNESDLSTTLIPNKRFTMKDIAQLENRIDKVEELATLSLLELNASSLQVVDSNGNPRTKSGFLAENFANDNFSDINNPEFRAMVDPVLNTLSAASIGKEVRLIFDSDENFTYNQNVKRYGDLLMLENTGDLAIVDQNLATTTENVNPFHVIISRGHIDLSPASDAWTEVEYIADNVVSGGTIRTQATRRNVSNLVQLRNQWLGTPFTGTVNLQVGNNVIREIIGDRVVSIELIPFMRSRLIGFRALGLQPNCKHFAFFGGQNVADWVREETFQRSALRRNIEGNIYTGATGHPDGSGFLFSDGEGKIEGTFLIPSTPSLRFRTGEQEFKLLNISVDSDDGSTSIARENFTSVGTLETRQRTVRSTRVVRFNPPPPPRDDDNNSDPLAQTFRIDANTNPNGLFISKVDAFFETKDDVVPIQCQIRPVENGIPTGAILPGAVKFLSPSEVAVPTDITRDAGLMTRIRNAPTSFEFEEPVYLTPGFEYAIVLLAESTSYKAYVAQTYEFIIGSEEARVTKQPTLGSLFLSQNGSTWTPAQEKDLMFKLYRAQFASTGKVEIKNSSLPKQKLGADPFLADSGAASVVVQHQGHGFEQGDKVYIEGLTAGTYANVVDSNITSLGTSPVGTGRVITAVDNTGYRITTDSAFTNVLRFGGNNILVDQQARFDTFFPLVTNILPNLTTLSAKAKTTSAASFAAASNTTGRNNNTDNYTLAGTFEDITINEFNTLGSPKVVLSDSNENNKIVGADAWAKKSFQMELSLTTGDDKVSPVIDMQRASLIAFENQIDLQDSAGGSTDGGREGNQPLSFVAETAAQGGTSASKYITIPITLNETAVGLKILLSANRPSEADFRMFFRTATADQVITDQLFVEVAKEVDLAANTDEEEFSEYEYLAGGQVGNLNAFTQFQLKIVMETTNSSRVPTLKDLRAIALVT